MSSRKKSPFRILLIPAGLILAGSYYPGIQIINSAGGFKGKVFI